jgi:hypothetical protein
VADISQELPRQKRRLRLPGGTAEEPRTAPLSPDEYADHQAAALWLNNAKSLGDIAKHLWLRDVARIYGPWTAAANGAGMDKHEEVTNPPREWNDAYFDLLARCLPGLEFPRSSVWRWPLTSLPNEPFFDATADFVRR